VLNSTPHMGVMFVCVFQQRACRIAGFNANAILRGRSWSQTQWFSLL